MPTDGGFTLDAEDWQVKIDAARGGQILDCTWRGHEVLATAQAGLWPADSHAGCFPLVPYSNRIRDAAFSFSGRRISLPASGFAMPHALHGLGWRQAWSGAQSGPGEITLVHNHDGEGWPWPYRARQQISIRGNQLHLTCEIENTGAGPMPAGIGLHPFFPRRPGTTLSLRAKGYWATAPDAPGLPNGWCELDPEADEFAAKAVASLDLDHCFTGWNRRARITYPDTGFSLSLAASPALTNLVIYCPGDRNILCLEPVSHVNDAANLAGLEPTQAMTCLEPGGLLSGNVVIEAALTPGTQV